MKFNKMLTSAVALLMVAAIPDAAAKQSVAFTEGEPVSLPAFNALALKGGGTVTVTASSDYSVNVVEGGERVELFMDGNSLQIRCRNPCRGNVKRILTVTVPAIESVAIAGGGRITFEQGFEAQGELHAAVVGGGTIDAFAVQARDVNAAVTGGGSLKVTASDSLNAAVVGGGSIVYDGDPEVATSTIGGGSVSRR